MSDEELVKRLREGATWDDDVAAADRIEALTAERDEHWKSFVHWRKEADALTEQLEAARADAKEAEAYAEEVEADRKKTYEALLKVSRIHGEVEAKLATCEKYRDAYAECDRIGTQTVRDLEDKLALMVFERDEVIMFERDEAWKRAAHAEKMWGEAEVKLAGGVLAEYDDGSTVFLSGYAGGAANGGAWSTLTLMEKAPDGTLRERKYKAQGDWCATLAEIKGESHEALPDLR